MTEITEPHTQLITNFVENFIVRAHKSILHETINYTYGEHLKHSSTANNLLCTN